MHCLSSYGEAHDAEDADDPSDLAVDITKASGKEVSKVKEKNNGQIDFLHP